MSYFIHLISHDRQCRFNLEDIQPKVTEVIKKLITLFSIEKPKADGSVTIDTLRKYDDEFEKSLNDFFSETRSTFPQIQQLNSFFKSLNKGDFFYFLPNIEHTEIEIYKYHIELKSLNENQDYEKLLSNFENGFGKILQFYNSKKIGDYRTKIGPNSLQKTCRFCDKSQPDTFFSKDAHAISEGLGNKKVLTKDECDICNDFFSEKIEPSLINFLSIFRTYFGIKGKDGKKKIKGKNLVIKKVGNELHFNFLEGTKPSIDGNNVSFNAKEIGWHSSQAMYKALVKFFLSVIETEMLEDFKDTVQWLLGNLERKKLPKVFFKIDHSVFAEDPKIFVFTRKSDSINLPFAFCEFQFTICRFIFLIPFSQKDTRDFLTDKQLKEWLSVLKFYTNIGSWKRLDLSSSGFKKMNLKFLNIFRT